MTHLPTQTKQRVFIAACAAWLAAAAWLVGCVVVAAPMRVGAGAVLALVLLGVAVGFVKHELEMDAIRARAKPLVDPSEDLFGSKP